MSSITQGPRTGPRDQIVFAAVLILVGICGLVLQALEATPTGGGLVVLFIGLGLLGAFAYTRHLGYLIPGGIMTGLGVGIVVSDAMKLTNEGTGGVIVLGLGLGFVSIWAIGAIVDVAGHHWWPLIPGGILAAIGAALLIGSEAIALLEYWWVVLIAAGVILIWQGWSRSRSRE